MEQVRLITDLAHYLPQLERACDYDIDGHSVLEIVERVKNGDFIALEIEGRAVLVLEVLERDSRVLNVVCLAGKGMRDWIDRVVETLHRLAKDQDCQRIRAQGRPGWAKFMRTRGFKVCATVLEAT